MSLFDRLRSLGLLALTAMFVATPLLPSENPASQTAGVVFSAMWLVLLSTWPSLASHVLR